MDTRSQFANRVKPAHPLLWGPLSSLGLSLAGLSFVADQLFKWWMLRVFDIATTQPVVVTPFFNLVLAWNQGVSYGWFAQSGNLGQIVLIAVSLLASAFLWVWLARIASPLTASGLGLIIGGALGNVIDRIIYGAVADFFQFHAFGFAWYVFNIADIAIVAGVLALIYESVTETRRPKT
ncbi:MAG TPA: signal peptidase II [Aestuariivirgaceae bacterium]|jgi:signal peptidase II|nr:signal peptidase II [Aestuariivirgaceae bacterium]